MFYFSDFQKIYKHSFGIQKFATPFYDSHKPVGPHPPGGSWVRVACPIYGFIQPPRSDDGGGAAAIS